MCGDICIYLFIYIYVYLMMIHGSCREVFSFRESAPPPPLPPIIDNPMEKAIDNEMQTWSIYWGLSEMEYRSIGWCGFRLKKLWEAVLPGVPE